MDDSTSDRFCYCDDCRGDGRLDPSVVHDPSKPPDTSPAACDARLDGLIAYLEGTVRPMLAARVAARTWGADDPEPAAA